MIKYNESFKFDSKSNKKTTINKNYNYIEEEKTTLRDVKRDYEHKKYRNYTNAIRAKDIDALMEYEDD